MDLRDLWRPGGGTSRLTWRRLDVLIRGLPPESRTKTAIRDLVDPFELAESTGADRPGWGPHSRTDEGLARLGERLDRIIYTLYRVNGGKPAEPAPWRRPGVLGARELAALQADVVAPVVDQIERERAERAAAKAAAKAAKSANPARPPSGGLPGSLPRG